jgi:hypothetical protein
LPLPPDEVWKTFSNEVFIMARLALAHIGKDDPGQVLMTSLGIRLTNRIVTAHSAWQLLHLTGGSYVL